MKIMTEKITKPTTVIHCTTEEQARHLLGWARSEGFVWMDGEPINLDFTQWCDWRDQTCYRLHFVNKEIGYADVNYYRLKYYIFEFEDIFITDEKSFSLENENLEDRVIGLIRRTHRELNSKQDLLSTKQAAHEIVKLVSGEKNRYEKMTTESLSNFKLKILDIKRQNINQKIEVIEAFLRGEIILCSKDGHHFFPDEDPTWDFDVNDYKMQES